MSSYYLIEIANGDKAIKGSAVYGYDALNDARADFFTKKGTAMESDLFDSEQLLVVDQSNHIHENISYYKEGITRNPDTVYLFEAKITTEDVETKNISTYDSEITAIAKLSKKFGSALKDDTCASEQLMAFNVSNGVLESEVYIMPTPEPEPEPEPEETTTTE